MQPRYYPWQASRTLGTRQIVGARSHQPVDRDRDRDRVDDVCKSIKRRRPQVIDSALIKPATNSRPVELSSNFVPASPGGDNEGG